MGYDTFKFGALYLDNEIQRIPQNPLDKGDIPRYWENAGIFFGTEAPGKAITWIKPHGLNLFIADRVLLTQVSWEDLNKNGFVSGQQILIDGRHFCCRLLQIGKAPDVLNEWDKVLDIAGAENSLWHWGKMFFWGADALSVDGVIYRAFRGYYSARDWNGSTATRRHGDVGFRPVLEPLPSDNSATKSNLDGIDFWLSSVPGGEGFCPILQPVQKDVFAGIPNGNKVRMYSFTEDGHPIRASEPCKDLTRLTLTDHYFGDEYLVPWTISNGVAVASQSLF